VGKKEIRTRKEVKAAEQPNKRGGRAAVISINFSSNYCKSLIRNRLSSQKIA
jgi:hypothetical protein